MLVSDLKERLSHAEYVGWLIYHGHNPPYFERHQLAALCSMFNNAWSKRRRQMDKFLPAGGPRKTAEQLEQEMMAFAHQHNARVRQD